jgi:NAD-dependent dihydropyrimidine dehydrogenase PreA subunit
MNMIVDQQLCTGCGICVDACPNEAIHINEGKAFIDRSKCTDCQICVEVCPTGALQLLQAREPEIAEKPMALEVLPSQKSTLSASWQSGLSGAFLSLVGQHVLPRLMDVLTGYLERRLNPPKQDHAAQNVKTFEGRTNRRHRQRRRQFSKLYSERR